MSERVIHMYNWESKEIKKKTPKIAEQRFTAIQIPTVQPFKGSYKKAWWYQYQPLSFDIGNEFGSKEQLISLCNKAHEYGLKIIVDVILTHMAGDDYGNIKPHPRVDKRLVEADIWKSFDRIYNWDDRHEVITKSHGMPTIQLAKPKAQEFALDFINRLRECGVDGLRLDSGKSIALPEEGNDFLTKLPKDMFIYAEVIFESKELIDKYCQYVNVLTSSCGSNHNNMVTFIDSHDLQNEFKVTTHYTDDMIKREYDILCGNFPNTLFYARPFNNCWESEEVKRANLR